MEPLELRTELARIHPRGFAWALRCCRGDRDEAEDVLHIAYEKVLGGRARFEGRSSFPTWLFGVIRRTALEENRRRWLRLVRADRVGREPLRDQAGADDGIEREETRSRLREALARLSKRQQEVLHLVFYQDLTVQEAADVLEMPVGTARTHYERGKSRLRRLLTPEAVG